MAVDDAEGEGHAESEVPQSQSQCYQPPVELDHEKVFWKIEKGGRFLNAEATPKEKHELVMHTSWTPKQKEMAEKVRNMFGQKGAGVAAKSLLSLLTVNMQPGEQVPWDSVGWTLCKHLMVAGWKKLPSKPEDGLDGEAPVICHCLPATGFMPKGCIHNKALYLEKVDHPYQIMCHQCSKCLRCEG